MSTTETEVVPSTEATTVKAPKKKAAAPKKGVKKAAVKGAKTATKKAAPKADKPASDKVPEYGAEKKADVPWSEKKVAVFKALRNPKLLNGEGTAAEIAEKGNVTARDARHYCYHAAAAGLVKIHAPAEGEGNKYRFSLTAKGAKVDPEAELKKQKAAKAGK